MKRFTDEQIERANNIDIADLLMRQGERLKKEGRVYRWQSHRSTIICGNVWFRHSEQVGGGPIQFMKHFYGMDFVESVKYLLNGEEGVAFLQAEHHEEERPELIKPEMSKNMHHTFAYLIKTRKIDADIVRHFVNEKKICETADYHNVAFCGYDEQGELKQIHLRSTIPGSRYFHDAEGSDKQYYFRYDGSGEDVYVFESPIDMLSYITLNKNNWQENSYVCLGGVAIDALLNVLRNNENIDMVHMCVDRDNAGDKTIIRIGEELDIMDVKWDRILPKNKDWNEDLIELCEQEKIQDNELHM